MPRQPLPIEERRTQITVSLPIEMLRQVRAEADDPRMTTTAVVVEALKAHLAVRPVPNTPRHVGQTTTE